ncbi:MAG: hypothetical protein K2J37_03285 [Ruminococcus sp.]|nr:hypothetical protein [Ruminococcus sp.]
MKKAGSYVFSFIIAVLLVFMLAAFSACLTARNLISADSFISIAEENNAVQLTKKELDKYFSGKASSSGIPTEVYTSALTDEYIENMIKWRIMWGFGTVNDSDEYYINPELEDNIDQFYSDYAESINYEKDDNYDRKVANAKNNAYITVRNSCDIFKFSALIEHGVMRKIEPILNRIPVLVGISCGGSAFLIILLFLINMKEKKSALYWTGIAALVSGLLCAVPCIYLKASDYFSTFIIKQPQIYAAYTGLMNTADSSFLTASVITAAAGAVLIVIYSIINAVKKSQ